MAIENQTPIHNMARLAGEFRLKLGSLSLPNTPISCTDTPMSTDTASSSSYGLPPQQYYFDMTNPTTIETVKHLRQIATTMSSAGYLDDCIHIYATELSQRFMIQKLSPHEVRNFDRKNIMSAIHDWNRSARVCVHFLLEEKQLFERIFHSLVNGSSSSTEDFFIKTVKEPVSVLFDNAETLCSVHLSPDIFGILEVYETLSTTLSESSTFIRLTPAQLLLKVAELIRRILSDFERDVLLEKSPALRNCPVVHWHTAYVISLVIKLCGIDYKKTLMTLIQSKPDSMGGDYDEGQTPLSLHLIWILMQLLSNLEAKSKLYKEASMAELFILINVDYIIGKIEGSSEFRELIGDGYLMELTGKLGQAKADYLDISLDKMLYCLRAEGLNGVSGIFSSKSKRMTKRLNTFNDEFGKAQRDLAKVIVPDSLFLEDHKKSISKKLIPAYSSFLEKLKNITGRGKHSAEQHIKYSVEELETAVQGLYTSVFISCDQTI